MHPNGAIVRNLLLFCLKNHPKLTIFPEKMLIFFLNAREFFGQGGQRVKPQILAGGEASKQGFAQERGIKNVLLGAPFAEVCLQIIILIQLCSV